MKNVLLSTFTACLCAMVFTSCESVDFAEIYGTNTDNDGAPKQTLKVKAQSTEGTITYPVVVYAFDADGNYVANQTIASSSSNLSLKLPSGTYNIVALAGTEGLTIPEVENINTKIDIMSQSTVALQMGSANVTIGTTPVSAYINMGYKVCGVRFTLSQVPEDAVSVSVTVSNIVSAMDFLGNPSGTSDVTIPLNETIEYGVWSSSEVYIMPFNASSTVLTISITRPDNTETYSYTHSLGLEKGTPYHFRGTYMTSGGGGDSNIGLSGNFIAATWNDLQTVDFNFGDYKKPTIVESGYIPAYSIWKGHAVVSVKDIDDHTEELLLFSLKEWTDVGGCKNSNNPNMADSIAKSYIEGEYGEWRMQTQAEVQAIRDMYIGEGKPSLSLLLESTYDENGNPGAPIEYSANEDDPTKGDNATYLCDSAQTSYSYSPKYGSFVTTKSATKKLYRLRLVKTITHSY